MAQPAEVDRDHLGKDLDLFAAEAHRTRVATAVRGLSIGAAVVPAGIILLGRTEGVSQALVIGTIVGGSAQLLSVPLSLIPYSASGFRIDLISFGYPIKLVDAEVLLELGPIVTLVRGEIMFITGGSTFLRMEAGVGLELSATFRHWFRAFSRWP